EVAAAVVELGAGGRRLVGGARRRRARREGRHAGGRGEIPDVAALWRVDAAVREHRVARAVAQVQPLGRRAQTPVGADLLAGGLGLFLGDVRPGLAPGDGAGAAGGVEAVVRRGRVVAGRLVGEDGEVLGGNVDDLVVGGLVRH